MPYGSVLETTRKWLTKRATESNISMDKLGLEPDMSFEEYEDQSAPDNLYEISVIYGGALDEEFYVQTIYEVNIADWIAEQCAIESRRNGTPGEPLEQWEIIVSEYAFEDAGTVRYRVSSEDYTGPGSDFPIGGEEQ